MTYEKFKRLLWEKEKAIVDFKLCTEVFLSKKEKPKAELAKDVCAMANNGNVANYIVVGVSNDRKSGSVSFSV